MKVNELIKYLQEYKAFNEADVRIMFKSNDTLKDGSHEIKDVCLNVSAVNMENVVYISDY
ncbi:hypothetical protein RUMCAL_00290 [Ruminococcus callidus ATCC 27760]|jgi:hypothetical protein|uniref:Uncharacterized protein n=1 Tax=Ruminococcus callidus ATCC 27760 TaxID=411473 RepID=U2MD32_9FIRM|nr:hypothetical protein [Ruminococcus callidus]ERJ97218.1 hypothetical protein RUMCAL_00290 [Ruminococcus callidus ATCC 27760]